jgi:hypothetical protein
VARADTRIVVDLPAVEEWIRMHTDPVGPIETADERPWATVLRVPLSDSVAWFKACAPVQAFEPRLTADLFSRWPDRVPEVLAYHEQRAWLLLADAGMSVGVSDNPPQAWLTALPRYAELQRGEAVYAQEHLAHVEPSAKRAAPREPPSLVGQRPTGDAVEPRQRVVRHTVEPPPGDEERLGDRVLDEIHRRPAPHVSRDRGRVVVPEPLEAGLLVIHTLIMSGLRTRVTGASVRGATTAPAAPL